MTATWRDCAKGVGLCNRLSEPVGGRPQPGQSLISPPRRRRFAIIEITAAAHRATETGQSRSRLSRRSRLMWLSMFRSSTMHRAIKSHPHHLRDAAGVVAIVAGHQLPTQPFDVAVNVPFIHIQRIVVGHIQQCISAPHHPEAAGEYMQKEKFGRSESVCPRDTYGDKAKPLAARSADGFAV